MGMGKAAAARAKARVAEQRAQSKAVAKANPQVKLKKATKGLNAWSFSRYTDYVKCPLLARLKHVDRIKEPEDPTGPMARGGAIHKKAEDFIKGTTRAMGSELKGPNDEFVDLFKELKDQFKKRRSSIVVEDDWAFTKTWTKTQWDNWADCWLRLKLDCGQLTSATTMRIIDWKTGKYREQSNADYVEQLELYALCAMLLNEQVQEVRPCLVYLDLGMVFPDPDSEIIIDGKQLPNEALVFTRADIPRLKKAWDKRVRKMLLDRTFAPKPNYSCRWCFYGQAGQAKGGPGLCKF